ncbi:sialate O-acetylesterase [Sphingomonas guangdongensis]|uniref:Sialate O-acetylesterase n=1 Tax=Sphingomonas guangdongensis TaxID=1141890 RepID=A0A285R5T4_9SPHN|nr:sialate O-acetylesterase [Sphingomonas guangdongensis]SOB87697.1 sialate O-acetylesterase [Sphingomonas guangdongensis]
MKLLVGAVILASATPTLAAPRVAGALSDRAVVQRDQAIVVAGTAQPGETVSVVLGPASGSARAGADGVFRVALPPLPAGGPFDLIVSARSGVSVLRDLLVGDVYLCSGQSNMEMTVAQSQNAGAVQGAPGDDQLRLLTIEKNTGLTPLARFAQQPQWVAAGPQTSPNFSAACFYMAQELRRTAKVPIGAVHSSWGGSQITAWMSDAAQRAAGRAAEADLLKLYARDPAAAVQVAAQRWQAWWREKSGDAPGREPWQPGATLDWTPVPSIGFYETWPDPKFATYKGMLWYRLEVTLTPEQARQAATLQLGLIDDVDQTWLNGKPVGGTSNWQPRVYPVPAGMLVPGRNVLVVNNQNAYSHGGLAGPADAMKLTFADGSSIPLGTGWRYAVVDKDPGTTPPVPWGDTTSSGTLHNAMIAPLGPTAFAGVAWYQGESDTGMPGYTTRLRALMADWRRQFGRADLPFALVSLAPFGRPATAPGESGTAYVRDAQRQVAESDGNAAVAITLDLGDAYDIHPGEKAEVGRRLARAMRRLVYRDPVAPSGPRATSATFVTNGQVVVRFADVDGALRTESGATALGFELCGAAAGTCRYAVARAGGAEVTIAGDGQPVTRVRYAWADTPRVNLVDAAALPAGPFELPVR